MLDMKRYALEEATKLYTPTLIYYKDIIIENTRKAIELAGGAHRLWPHVKTHKMRELILLQQSMGIERFKCATMAEMQMVAECGAPHILMAYPVVGPAIGAFLSLAKRYPQSQFYAIGDDTEQLRHLSEQALAAGLRTPVLLDLNLGMDRTGVSLERMEAVYRECAALPGIEMVGIHGYDGHRGEKDIAERIRKADETIARVEAVRSALEADGIRCDTWVLGGTPSFPTHARRAHVFLSPGTLFVTDWGYYSKYRDLPFEPGALVLSRVVSHPGERLFALDVGNKGIACEMAGARALLLGYEQAEMVRHSEEHFVLQLPEGVPLPAIGTEIYVIPTHICPTNALYEYAHVVEGGRITGKWTVTARHREIRD